MHIIAHYCTLLHIVAHDCTLLHIVAHECTLLHIVAHDCTLFQRKCMKCNNFSNKLWHHYKNTATVLAVFLSVKHVKWQGQAIKSVVQMNSV